MTNFRNALVARRALRVRHHACEPGRDDFAQGGARVVLLPGVPNTPPTATALPIASQVAQHFGAGVDPGALYGLWGGGNDISTQLGLAGAGVIASAQAQAAVILAATQFVQQVAALQAAGVQNLIVFNLPDIRQIPGGRAGGPRRRRAGPTAIGRCSTSAPAVASARPAPGTGSPLRLSR